MVPCSAQVRIQQRCVFACEYVVTSKPNKKTLLSVSYVSECVSLCFISAILSLITLWQQLYISSGVESQLFKSGGRKGLKRKKGERVMGIRRGAAVSGSACPPLSAGCV